MPDKSERRRRSRFRDRAGTIKARHIWLGDERMAAAEKSQGLWAGRFRSWPDPVAAILLAFEATALIFVMFTRGQPSASRNATSASDLASADLLFREPSIWIIHLNKQPALRLSAIPFNGKI